MRLMVAGSAACLDLIFHCDRIPGSSEFALLLPTPATEGTWSHGGAAMSIALFAVRLGHEVALWHPRPSKQSEETDLAALAAEGVDLSRAPVFDGGAVRSVIVYAPEQRLGWSMPPADVPPPADPGVLDGVEHLVVAPVWGSWTDALVQMAGEREIPCSLVGFADPRAEAFDWHFAVLDKAQAAAMPGLTAAECVVTDGPRGATVTTGSGQTTVPALGATPVDATGAGDSFAAAYIARRLSGESIAGAGTTASRIAARVIETWGSRPPAQHFADLIGEHA